MEDTNPDNSSHAQWYTSERPLYQGLADSVLRTLEDAIADEQISIFAIAARAKTVVSFEGKIERRKNQGKPYTDPRSQTTDFAGVRVITYIESDVKRVSEIIDEAFHIHEDKSGDKSNDLAADRFGYRSVHFVCDLGEERIRLRENKRYEGRVFEIQVRSVLQHAWAEIEHDRGYKLGYELPKTLKRRFSGIAATLEILDREFNGLVEDLAEYAKSTEGKIKAGDFSEELNATSLPLYVQIHLPELGYSPELRLSELYLHPVMLKGMRSLGIETIADLNTYFTPEFVKASKDVEKRLGAGFMIHLAIMYADIDKYFQAAATGYVGPDVRIADKMFASVLKTNYTEEQIKKYFPHATF